MRSIGRFARAALRRPVAFVAAAALSIAAAGAVMAAPAGANARPVADFTHYPTQPEVGEPMALTSIAADPDGPIVEHSWDLDGDGGFDDASGATALRAFPTPGVHRVGLWVRDEQGATAVATKTITVTARSQMLSPFPVVRIVGRLVRGGAYIRRLSVRAPTGTRVTLRCRGRRCPYRRASVRPRRGRAVRFRRMQRWLPAGTLIKVLVSHRRKIGKYTGFRIRSRRPPKRRDLCLLPGARRGTKCPAE